MNKFPLIKITTSMFDTLNIIPSSTTNTTDPFHRFDRIKITQDMYISRRKYYSPSELNKNILYVTAKTLKEFNDPQFELERYIIPYHNFIISAHNENIKSFNKRLYVPNKELTEYNYWRRYRLNDNYKKILQEQAKLGEMIMAFSNEKNYSFISKDKNVDIFIDEQLIPKLPQSIAVTTKVQFLSENSWEDLPQEQLLHHFKTLSNAITYFPLPADTYVKLITKDNIQTFYYINSENKMNLTSTIPLYSKKRNYINLNDNHSLSINFIN